MYLVLVIIVTAVLSLAAGYTVEQAYGQTNMTDMTGENMTGTNMTTSSSNMTEGTEDDNATKGSVSGGIAVSDPGSKGG